MGDPIEFAQDEDNFYIGGKASPGICKLSGFKRGYGWEVKKGKGVKGSTATLNEFPPAEGTITVFLWLQEHFAEWNTFKRMLHYDPTKKAVNAVDIFHAVLAEIDITRVVCKSIGQRTHDGKGLYSIAIELLEYNPPPKKSAVSTPDGSKNTGGKTPGKTSDPIADAKQAEINRLLKEAKEP